MCWRVQLAAIELEETNTGKRLKWVFQTRDKQHTIVGYTNYSTGYRSKCAKWVKALLNKNYIPTRPIDLEQLIGNEVYCWIKTTRGKDGTERYVAHDLEKVGKPYTI
jgi:hypothetical protein